MAFSVSACVFDKWSVRGDVDVSGLYCPFLSEQVCVPRDHVCCSYLVDALPAAPTPWHALLDKVILAYSCYTRGALREGRAFLVDSYAHLLPAAFPPCDLINEYREALRHLLDSCWAIMCLSEGKKDKHLRTFVASITPFKRLPMDQTAALFAIQSKVNFNRASAESLLRVSVSLSPSEGEWRCMLGNALRHSRYGSPPSREEVELLREAHRERPHPYSAMQLARSLADTKKGRREAECVAEAALARYPDHPYVLVKAADLLSRQAAALLQRATDIIGDRAFIRIKLGGLCREQGREQDAQAHYRAACDLNPAASPVYKALFMTKKTC